ncbi:MAG TPA: hypothetical protein VGA58_09250 [bacterium]
MDRRTFLSALSGSLLAAPLLAEAQQYKVGKTVTIGYLVNSAPSLESHRRGHPRAGG